MVQTGNVQRLAETLKREADGTPPPMETTDEFVVNVTPLTRWWLEGDRPGRTASQCRGSDAVGVRCDVDLLGRGVTVDIFTTVGSFFDAH